MPLFLHNPVSEAHLEELRDRLFAQLAFGPCDPCESSSNPDLIEGLLEVVRCMDKGTVTTGEALEAFTRAGVPSFSKWLVDMLDEGVYLDTRFEKAAKAA